MFFQQLLYSLIKYLLEKISWHVHTAKAGLKLSIQRTKIMASGPITSWQIDGGKSRNSDRFIFLGFKITVVSDCSHEIKRWLLLGRKVMTNLDSILKSQRHYFANKGLSSQGYGFSSSHVWMLSWIINKAERSRIDVLNCGVGEDSWESLGLQGYPTSPS